MLKQRATASLISASIQQLWDALGSKLIETAQGRMPSKQWVGRSSRSRDAIFILSIEAGE